MSQGPEHGEEDESRLRVTRPSELLSLVDPLDTSDTWRKYLAFKTITGDTGRMPSLDPMSHLSVVAVGGGNRWDLRTLSHVPTPQPTTIEVGIAPSSCATKASNYPDQDRARPVLIKRPGHPALFVHPHPAHLRLTGVTLRPTVSLRINRMGAGTSAQRGRMLKVQGQARSLAR